MWFRSALDLLTSRNPRTAGRQKRRGPARRRPTGQPLRLEQLEDRRLLASYVLTELGNISSRDINSASQVVGASSNHAALWNNGTLIDLGTLDIAGLNGGSQASAINDLGQIVGWSDVKARLDYPYFESHAFLITPEDTDADGGPDRWFRDLDADGVNDLMIDLGVPAGTTSSFGLDLNNAGQVIVTGYDKWFLWDRGALTELTAFGGAGSAATGINDAGQVVGYARNALGDTRVVLWDSSRGATGLGDASGYTHVRATAINKSGSVVGSGYDSTFAFFLIAFAVESERGSTPVRGCRTLV